VSNHFLESCHIKKNKAFYNSLGNYSIPVKLSETNLNCTNQSETAPPIRAYNKGGILINNSTVQFR